MIDDIYLVAVEDQDNPGYMKYAVHAKDGTTFTTTNIIEAHSMVKLYNSRGYTGRFTIYKVSPGLNECRPVWQDYL